MRRDAAIRAVAEVAAGQWGLVTAAQAKAEGLSAVDLFRLTEAEYLFAVGRGVYQVAGAAMPEHLEIKVAWLRLAPKVPGWKRLEPGTYQGVVSHGSACDLHGIGDLPSHRVEICVPRRRTTREPGVRLRIAAVDPTDVVLVDGLPTTTATRTVADLLTQGVDAGHAGDAIADAANRNLLDMAELAERVTGLAPRYGLPAGTAGETLLRYLIDQASAELRAGGVPDTEIALQGILAGIEMASTVDAVEPARDLQDLLEKSGADPAVRAAMSLLLSAIEGQGKNLRKKVPSESERSRGAKRPDTGEEDIEA